MINIEKQRVLLEDARQKLENELNVLGRRSADGGWMVIPDEGDGNHADPVDNADVAEDFEEKIARLNVLETQHAQIVKALAAMDNGTYGVCDIGGEKIPEKRLKAYPAATTCVDHSH
ncbi:TraR/DksA C4-type zinc finger protein [Patescibacteria group bacterium]|nr:TraR/DksA C4-type zinc finger protein [Patescibacteria group bacterium]